MQYSQRHVAGADVQQTSGLIECALDFGTGRVASGMHDAPPRVPTFTRESPTTG